MAKIKKLTVREGFTFFRINASGTSYDIQSGYKAGSKIDIDITSEEFQGQKIKFVEFVSGQLSASTATPTFGKTPYKRLSDEDLAKLDGDGGDDDDEDIEDDDDEDIEDIEDDDDDDDDEAPVVAMKVAKKKTVAKKTVAKKKVKLGAKKKKVSKKNGMGGAFPSSLDDVDFDDFDDGYLETWAMNIGASIDEDASREDLIEALTKKVG